jgi:hypothetical protein
MATPPKSPEASSSPVRPLIERVRERVDRAAASLGPGGRSERRGAKTAQTLSSGVPREVRAMRRVFREMGRTQRTARRQTGQAPSPVVREAALAFREAPSLSALVLVAASLDEVGLLSW